MYCRNCGRDVHPQAVACPACGVPPKLEKRFCPHCGSPTLANQALCTKCGVMLGPGEGSGEKTRLVTGLLAIFLGWLGIHKFYLGYNKEGLIMILISLLAGTVTCGVATAVISVIGIVEGVMYLTKSDDEFAQVYVYGRKTWF
jgi:TM2 domain-containing membrane protein YozV